MATKASTDKPSPSRRPVPVTARKSEGAPQATTASSWRQQTREGTPLVVPSGNTCLVRPSSGLDMFVRNGHIPNSLMPIIQDAINKGKPPTMDQLDLEANPDLLESIIELTDTACIFMVLEPQIRPVPKDEAGEAIPFNQRDEGDYLYVDEVMFEDKMFIFNWAVGGTADLETFRQELSAGLEPVPGS